MNLLRTCVIWPHVVTKSGGFIFAATLSMSITPLKKKKDLTWFRKPFFFLLIYIKRFVFSFKNLRN